MSFVPLRPLVLAGARGLVVELGFRAGAFGPAVGIGLAVAATGGRFVAALRALRALRADLLRALDGFAFGSVGGTAAGC